LIEHQRKPARTRRAPECGAECGGLAIGAGWRHTYSMQSAFGTVLWVVCGLGLVGAVVALLRSGKTWQDFGAARLLMDGDSAPAPKPGSQTAVLERDLEIRQLLEARNVRRERRGEPPLDVEAELAALTALTAPAPAIDPALRAEIREMVIARNYRRARSGKPQLDVEAETERQVARLCKG
jgi:hypothetical protein